MVNALVACPSRSEMTLAGWPAASSIVAVPCRRSWNRIGGSPAGERAEPGAGPARAQRRAVLAGEHAPGVGPGRAPGDPLGKLCLAPGAEDLDGARVDRHLPVGVLALGRVQRIVNLRLADVHTAAVEVEIGPAEAHQLGAAQPAVGGDVEQRIQPLGGARRIIAGASESRNAPHWAAVQAMTGAGISPVWRRRSTRGAVRASGRSFRPPRLPPGFTAAAGLYGSVCGTASARALSATEWIRLIRASDSGRVETRLPSRSLRPASRRRSRSPRSAAWPGRFISRMAAYRSRK